ncbi:MAG: Ig-like domain repeat protein [Terriglobales bacterium]
MPRHFAREHRTLSVVTLFVVTCSVLAVFAAPATAQNPVPFIDPPLVPDATAPGSPAFTLTVNGAGFVAASVVNWNGSARATAFVSSAQLTATILASDIATAATAAVTVVNPSPGGGVSNTLFFSIATAATSVSFLPAVTYDSGGSTVTWVAVADVNGDGKLDLIVANQGGEANGDGSVAVMLGNGDGTFQAAVTYDSGGPFPDSLGIADLNGDGKLDIVVANRNNSTVGVLLGNGDGTFQPSVAYSSGGENAVTVAVGDVNRDGKLDLLVANEFADSDSESGSVGVLLGNGDGTFQTVVTYSSGAAATGAVAVADLTGDGKLDLVITNFGGEANGDGNVGVLLGNGDGTFQPVVLYDAGGVETRNVAVADVNGDGKPDLLTANLGSTVGVLLGNGDGTFQSVVSYAAGNSPFSIAVADVNGDGKQDAVTANWGGGANVLLGNGNGTFQAAQTLSANGADSVAVADLTGDGRLDIVLADTTSPGLVSVLLNNPGTETATTTTLSSTPNPSNYGQMVTFTATVTSSSGPPTGNVIFYDGSTQIGSATLSSGTATFSTSSLPAGSDPMTAAYQGSSSYSPSTSGVVTQVVNGAATTTSIGSSPNPTTYGQAVIFTATVTSGSGTPTGTVIFYDGSIAIGSATLSNGIASVSTSSLPAGSQSITAAYQGAVGFNSSTSAPLTQVVDTAVTTTALTSSSNPDGAGQSVTFTATVAGQYGGAVTGSVIFSSGSQTLGTATLNANTASVTTSFSTPGSYPITAQYSGDANNTGSTGSLSQVIIASTNTTVSASPNPAFVDDPVTFTANVTSAYGTPTGSVSFYIRLPHMNGYNVSSTLSGGVATYTVASRYPGKTTFAAAYNGSPAFAASSSPFETERVSGRYVTSTSVTSSLNPSQYGQPVTFTATVGSPNGAIPDGETVKFFDKAKEIGTGTTSSGVATFTTSTLKSTTHDIKATYAGDETFATSSGTVTQVVTPYSTSTTLTSSLNPSTYGQSVTWTATVTSTGPYVPTGKVKFAGLGTATLSGGVATLTKIWLNTGTYAIAAEYEGDDASAPSTSSTLNQVVNPDSTTTTVTSSPNPSSQGQTVTFTATVTTSTGVNSAGTVTFTAGGTTLGTATLTGNVASVSTSTLPVGTSVVQATYNGETNFNGSSGTVSQTVSP